MTEITQKTHKLPFSFYNHSDVVGISRDLLGKYLCTFIDGKLTEGIIVETEAYCGATDRACHAYPNKRTSRTEIMFGPGGVSYVFLIYGVHSLFNIVTNKPGFPDAVLIRAVEPVAGLETMLERRRMNAPSTKLTSGPGALTKALGIGLEHYGVDLTGDVIWIEDRGLSYSDEQVMASPRVNVDYAGEDALLPWRFRVRNNRWTSPAK